jgi:hypothetical protein
MKRTTDPKPEHVLEALGQIISRLWEQNAPIGEGVEQPFDRFTHGDVRRAFAVRMNEEHWRFSSDYRHEVSPMHSACYHILGSTVGLNWIADDFASKTAEDRVNA